MSALRSGAHGSISATCLADVTVVRLSGEIDQGLRPQASSALAASLRRHVPVVLDAEDVTFIDASGLSFVIQCSRIGHEQGLSVRMATCSPCVHDMLEMVGADSLFDGEPDGAEPRSDRG
ncbi:STAS domain-containing protein [Cellulomonas septica]|uniref:STAS domain-containing protein n=1 Tax=Cellulomonas septica TaxID=285080 RepID=A0ABX1JUT8_9CELL|nr:STAS domain-containing protein [Cellulomonas septica]NKY38065.1 STAS domain-containing protein [Cellulomonas septica]